MHSTESNVSDIITFMFIKLLNNLLILGPFSDASSSSDYMASNAYMNDELEQIWKDAVVNNLW
jgi:hypothetical protein